MNSHSGIDVSNIIQASEVFHQADKIEKREKTLGTIVQVMHRYNYRPCTEYDVNLCFYMCVSAHRRGSGGVPQSLVPGTFKGGYSIPG